jgi:transposase InsO family protein
MPWKASTKVDERTRFVMRVLTGDKMTDVCHEFGISRKTGYKIIERFKRFGGGGLNDQSRRPLRLANLLDSGTADIVLGLKREKPTWGAPKLRRHFMNKYPYFKPPAMSTIHALLVRNNLVKKRQTRSGYKASGTNLSIPTKPNDLWCTDFKGQFLLGDKSYCYPLTITDQVSRYILAIEGMERISEEASIEVFRSVFDEFGVPLAIRSDNGVPFSSKALFGLSKLSVFWLRLGIKLERIVPGKPQQNGRHERMHKTLKYTVTRPPSKTLLTQQEVFDDFVEEFNTERPHEALAMKTPSDLYVKSNRKYFDHLGELDYPYCDCSVRVSKSGHVRFRSKSIFISNALSGQNLGFREVDDGVWEISFMEHDLGYLDLQTCKLTPGENPFMCRIETPQSCGERQVTFPEPPTDIPVAP